MKIGEKAGAMADEPDETGKRDPLMVASVEKAFRVLGAFGKDSPTLGLTQIAEITGLDKSAAQRFTHTLMRLGYIEREDQTKRWRLALKTLELGYHFISGHAIIQQAQPYLLQLGQVTEGACNLTLLDDTEIVFVSRFPSRHMLATDIVVGSRMPAYCSASGIAILSRLPEAQAMDIIDRSDLRAYTPHTTFRPEDLRDKLAETRQRGFTTCFDEYYIGDLSIAAPIIAADGRPVAAINAAVSRAVYTPEEAVTRIAPAVAEVARAASGRIMMR